jgi:hypothetical protein
VVGWKGGRSYDQRLTAGLESGNALLDVGLPVGQHGVDQTRELMGGRLDRFGAIHARQPCAMASTNEGVAASRIASGLSQGLASTIESLGFSPGKRFAAGDMGRGCQSEPGVKMTLRNGSKTSYTFSKTTKHAKHAKGTNRQGPL